MIYHDLDLSTLPIWGKKKKQIFFFPKEKRGEKEKEKAINCG